MKLICRRCQSELEINAADLKKIGKRCLQCGFPTLETPADNCELQLSAQSSGAPQPSQNSLRQSTMQNHPAVASKATDDSRSHRTCARLITTKGDNHLAVNLTITSDEELPRESTVFLTTPDGLRSHDQLLNLTRKSRDEPWKSAGITLHLQHRPGVRIGVFSVRVNRGIPGRFHEGRLLLQHEQNGRVTVSIDNRLHGNDNLGGVIENNLHLHQNGMPAEQTIELHETTALQPFHRDDFRTADHLDLKYRKTLNNEAVTAEVPLRLTLRRTEKRPQLDQHILLVVGKTLRLGRANTWSSQHLSQPPNDLILRVPETAEPVVNYISNTHAMIAREQDALCFEDYSKHGSLIDSQVVHKSKSRLNAMAGHLKPGTNGADRPECSLKLKHQRIPWQDPQFLEKLRSLADFEKLSAAENHCSDVLVLSREDAPETCIFMLDVLRVGYDQTTCGWLLPGHNQQCPIQAIVFRLGDGIWITPGQQGSNISFNGIQLAFENIVRLKNNMHLSIDGHQFIAEPWRQHFVT